MELACVLSKNIRRPSTCQIVVVTAIFTSMLTSTLRLLVNSIAAAVVLALLVGAALAIAL